MAGEAIVKSTGTRGIQHFFQSLKEEITQRNIAIMVQTAGNDRTVHEHTYLVAQSIAEDLLSIESLTFLVWPLEDVVVLQIYIVRHLPTVITLRPGAWHVI